ncbi:MAG: hypothetical protein QG608_739 [Actinomycetota bacterium]|nr:hypothetical protein [Actinomycetota bacterium]
MFELFLDRFLLAVTLLALLAGAVLLGTGRGTAAEAVWATVTLLSALRALTVVVGMLRRGRIGADLIAVLALLGSVAVAEYLAGILVAVMLSTGQTLESYARRRAHRDLRSLLEHAPRSARRRGADGGIEQIGLDDVRPGDTLLVAPGEIVPVDGQGRGPTLLDESVLTGEPLPVERPAGDPLRSGAVNAGPSFEMTATATADRSTYAGIVQLAEQAGAELSPTVRLADRYAAGFLPLSLLVAGAAWCLAGDPVRAVAVLVVATPCPLLLAIPIAIVSGLSRTARRGVVVRDGAALEALGQATTLLVDKTGTLTVGRPRVTDVTAAPEHSPDHLLSLAAAVEALSEHVLAGAVVREAAARRLQVPQAGAVTEEPGSGVVGQVDGHRVRVGRLGDQVPPWARRVQHRAEAEALAVAWVEIDGRPAGAILLHDRIRHDAPRTVRRLRRAGFRRIVMLTGDRPGPAAQIAEHLGLDDAVAECTPEDKTNRVRAEAANAVTVMVGDGVNDAPALVAAQVGVAMGARGATASAQVADAVLTVDRLDRLADTVVIARRSRRIGVQSAVAGMGMSLVAMAVAAVGLLPPAAGAFLQEAIDVVVILNALRALTGDEGLQQVDSGTDALLRHFAADHEVLHGALDDLRAAADALATDPLSEGTRAVLLRAHRRLIEDILPHERAEEHGLYPALVGAVGYEVTAAMSRAHLEIDRLATRLTHHLQGAPGAVLQLQQVPDLLAVLYGLHAILELHFSQEEENFFSLAGRQQEGALLPQPVLAGTAPARSGAIIGQRSVR